MNTQRKQCCGFCVQELNGIAFDFRVEFPTQKEFKGRCQICGKERLCRHYLLDDVGRSTHDKH